jgi:hypothetical protein
MVEDREMLTGCLFEFELMVMRCSWKGMLEKGGNGAARQ